MTKKRKGRAVRKLPMDRAKLKSLIDKLGAPTEGLNSTIVELQASNVELQVINDQLHKTNKVLTRTLSYMMGEFNERLSALETAQFGEVKGDFSKYLTPESEEDQHVQVQEVQGDDTIPTADVEAGEVTVDGGPSDDVTEVGNPGGDSTLH